MSERDDVRRAYDILAEEYARVFPATEPESALDLAMLDHFVSMLPNDRPAVLDAGCGTGRIARYLADHGCAVTGVDLSPGMLAMARRDQPHLRAVAGSITELPYGGSSFDGIVYWYSIIHLPDAALPRVFAEARRVLGPHGHVVLGFQAGDEVLDISGRLRDRGHEVERLTRYHRRLDMVLAVAAAHWLFPIAQLTREPVGTDQEPQAFAVLAVDG